MVCFFPLFFLFCQIFNEYKLHSQFTFSNQKLIYPAYNSWIICNLEHNRFINIYYVNYFRESTVNVSSAIWYNLAQTGIYAIMAIGVMRLKLFFTPHLCIIAGLLAKRNVSHYKYRSVSHYVFTYVFFSLYLDFSLVTCLFNKEWNVPVQIVNFFKKLQLLI